MDNRHQIESFVKEWSTRNRGRNEAEVIEGMYIHLLTKIKIIEEKLHVLLHEPTPDQLRRYKVLQEAYKRYKFVENLVLGDESEHIHN